jgi:hypothetical protein
VTDSYGGANGSSHALLFAFAGGTDQANCQFEMTFDSIPNEVWWSMEVYLPDGTEGHGSGAWPNAASGANNKWFRMLGRTNHSGSVNASWGNRNKFGASNNGAPSDNLNPSGGGLGQLYGEYSDGGGMGQQGNSPRFESLDISLRGSWHSYKIHWKYATSPTANNGVFDACLDDELASRGGDALNNYPADGSGRFVDGLAIFDAQNSGYVTAQHLLADDIRIYEADPQWACMR